MARKAKKQTRKGKHPMSETQKVIEIEVLRYLPESDQAPHSEVYKVPFTDDMSVLQGAQYIKDNFDGSLTFRWSCRMAICGSCGMMINGIPKLSCETFIRDYYPNRQLPDREGPGRRPVRLHREARKHPAVHHPEGAAYAGAGRIHPVAGTVCRVHSIYFLYQLHALLRGLSASRFESRLHRAGRDGVAAPLQHGLA